MPNRAETFDQEVETMGQITRFTNCLFEPADIVELRRLDPVKQTWHAAGDLATEADRLLVDNRNGANVHVGVNPRLHVGGATSDAVGLARCLCADFDPSNFGLRDEQHVTLDSVRERIATADLPPATLIVDSGHGFHVYWRLIKEIEPRKWIELQQLLIRAVHSDPAIKDPARTLRLPGFTNHKFGAKAATFIVEEIPARRYAASDLDARLDRFRPATPPSSNVRASRPPWLELNESSPVSRGRAYLSAVPAALPGSRNNTAFRAAAVLTQNLALPLDVAARMLGDWNARLPHPLGADELGGVVRSASRSAYRLGSTHSSYFGKPRIQGQQTDPSEIRDGDPWPEALGAEALHGLAGEIVRAIEPHSEADPVALLSQFLVGFGNLIGPSAHFRAEGDCHPAKLNACLVGRTAKGRKGSSWGQCRRVLAAVDPDWADKRVQSGLSSGEGLIWQVRDAESTRSPTPPTRPHRGFPNAIDGLAVEVDVGVNDKRLLVLESEMGGVLQVLKRRTNTLGAIVRDAWDKDVLRVLTKNAPATATGCHISIVGHITRDELRRHISQTDLANGFANRFLWLCVRRSKCLPEGGNLDDRVLGPLVEQVRNAADFARRCGELRRDLQARELWAAIYPDLSEGRAGLLGAVTSRAEAQVMRLALVYALLDRAKQITVQHLMAGIALWDYAEQSAKYVFGSELGDPLADEIKRHLRAAGTAGLTRTDVSAALGRNVPSEEVERALSVLLEAQLARNEKEQASGPGRRTTRWYAA